MTYIAYYLVLHLPALGLCYWLWIQHERSLTWKARGGWRAKVAPGWLVFHFFGAVGFIPDVVANYTTLFALFKRWPRRAFTFSKHLPFLMQLDGWRGFLAWKVARALNWMSPIGLHVPLPVSADGNAE